MLYYKATAGCGVGMFVGVSARRRAAPVTLILGRVAALPPPSAAFLSPSPPAAHSPGPSVCLAPSSRPPARPPPRTVSVLPSPCAALFCWASGRTLPLSLSPSSLFLYTLPPHPLFSQEQRLLCRPSMVLLLRLAAVDVRGRRRRLSRCGVARPPLLPPRMPPYLHV